MLNMFRVLRNLSKSGVCIKSLGRIKPHIDKLAAREVDCKRKTVDEIRRRYGCDVKIIFRRDCVQCIAHIFQTLDKYLKTEIYLRKTNY